MCMLRNKRKTVFFCCIAIISLLMGLLIYLVYRENTYIAKYVSNLINLNLLDAIFLPFENNFLKYYFVDFLWAFSFCCGLYAIYKPMIVGSIGLTFAVFLFGSAYEFLQYIGIINGTGDIADIILYLLAALAVNLINFIIIKKEEKMK